MLPLFKEPDAYLPQGSSYRLLPFRFTQLDSERYVLINEVGEWVALPRSELELFVRRRLSVHSRAYADLKSKHFLYDSPSDVAIDLLTLKARTKRNRIPDFTSLHMVVVTLRCNHSCKYCQVSRQSEDSVAFDMPIDVADKAVAFAFQSPSPCIKFEFQGGEPLLNFPVIRHIVLAAEARNLIEKRSLAFVIATNLSLISDEVLSFCKQHAVTISTSLDGPEDLHNSNRHNATGDSYQLTVQGIQKVRDHLGPDGVSALMTTTEGSLGRVREIVDEYIQQGFRGIFLRSLSPFGYAVKTKFYGKYDSEQWLNFYREGLEYILQINKNGFFFVEYYTALLLEKMLTPYGTGFVNLQSPAGMGIAGIIFNYDGEVYPSDEARMKAAMGDKIFCMGNLLSQSYEEIMLSPGLLTPLEESVAESVPMCEECAFLPYCGSDPDYHYATQKDFVGHKALSGFCHKHTGIFKHLIKLMEDDPATRRILESWVRW